MMHVALHRPAVWLGAALAGATFGMSSAEPLFRAWFPELERPLYGRADFLTLLASHAGLALGAATAAALAGIGAGVLATRARGRAFLPLAQAAGAAGQTFPPVAVLAVAVPLAGYGPLPAFIALALYGLLPVLETTLAGLRSVPADALDAADATGFAPAERLWLVELPLAAPTILSGVRTATVIGIGTATIGSTVGALTLGSPIIEGLSASNPAYVVQGAVLVGLLALFVDALFGEADRALRRGAA